MGIEPDSVTTDEASEYGVGGSGATQNPTQLSNSGYDVFHSLLLEWGFTGSQLLMVHDALRDAGLQITACDPDS